MTSIVANGMSASFSADRDDMMTEYKTAVEHSLLLMVTPSSVGSSIVELDRTSRTWFPGNANEFFDGFCCVGSTRRRSCPEGVLIVLCSSATVLLFYGVSSVERTEPAGRDHDHYHRGSKPKRHQDQI